MLLSGKSEKVGSADGYCVTAESTKQNPWGRFRPIVDICIILISACVPVALVNRERLSQLRRRVLIALQVSGRPPFRGSFAIFRTLCQWTPPSSAATSSAKLRL